LFKKKVLQYEGFGKNFTEEHRTSPDATAQLIKQLAFYKIFGRPGVTCESAQTRKFQLGRTDAIRTASKESKAWVEAMLDPKQQVRIAFLSFSIFIYLSLLPFLFFTFFILLGSYPFTFIIHLCSRPTHSIRNMGS
jgi:Choline/Carnitine o-acyltransferase